MNLIPKLLTAVDVNTCSHFSDHQGPPSRWVDEADVSYQLSQSFPWAHFPAGTWSSQPAALRHPPHPSAWQGKSVAFSSSVWFVTAAFPPLISPRVSLSSLQPPARCRQKLLPEPGQPGLATAGSPLPGAVPTALTARGEAETEISECCAMSKI